jgi:hypothetical protein
MNELVFEGMPYGKFMPPPQKTANEETDVMTV